MTVPLVSIIIPTYNYGHFLTEALDSVLAQTYSHWECIIIDDGSTDDTAALVAKYMSEHPQQPLSYLAIPNQGLAHARNVGIQQAKGQYLQFLDADDLISKDKLQIQVEKLIGLENALVFSASRFFRMDGIQRTYVEKYPKGFLATETLSGLEPILKLIQNNRFTVNSVLVPIQMVTEVGMFDESLRSNEDWLLWFNIALRYPTFIFDANPLSFTEIRVHPQSLMAGHQQMFLTEERVRLVMDQYLRTFNLGDSYVTYNQDLLALHRVRSLALGQGMRYVMHRVISYPRKGLPLFFSALYKLMGRIVDQKAWKIRSSS